METIINVGADVHKDTNSVCMFDWNDGSFFAEAVIEPGVENMMGLARIAASLSAMRQVQQATGSAEGFRRKAMSASSWHRLR